MLAVLTLALIGATFALPRVIDLPGLGVEPGTVGGTVTLPIGAAPPTVLYFAQIDNDTYLIVSGTEAQTAQFLAGNIDQLIIAGAQFPNFKDLDQQGGDFRVVVSNSLFGSPPNLAFNFVGDAVRDAADVRTR